VRTGNHAVRGLIIGALVDAAVITAFYITIVLSVATAAQPK
jgi:hypothetical protein